MNTIGLSPKVAAVLAAVGGPGIILLVLGLVFSDETLKTVGLSLIGGSAVGGAAGYHAPAGAVAGGEAEIRDLHDGGH
jgi:hypothetical protein